MMVPEDSQFLSGVLLSGCTGLLGSQIPQTHLRGLPSMTPAGDLCFAGPTRICAPLLPWEVI